MGRAFIATGIVALIGAVAWWQTFYSEVQRLLGPTGPLPIECLYSMSSACRVVANAADLFGANSYHPLDFLDRLRVPFGRVGDWFGGERSEATFAQPN
jgi:hypothetical protein